MKMFAWILMSVGLASLAGGWPQWQGPDRSGVSEETMPALESLKVAWQREVGLGFSGIATAGKRAYTMGNNGQGQETLFCLDARDGNVVWQQSYAGKRMPKRHVGGPQCNVFDHESLNFFAQQGRPGSLSQAGGRRPDLGRFST